MQAFSLLDLAPILEGGDARQALLNSRDLAARAEKLGYRRFWMAEHHNSAGIASSATSVALGFIAAGTQAIRVGAAGVMLPNHAPLVIAEQYGTLASLYPGRVDLGLGRAPGTDQNTMRALRRDHPRSVQSFPQDVQELIGYFGPEPLTGISAIPGRGLAVPVWILGSSLYGAQLAAALGLPYIFASHFAPDLLDQALEVYREEFTPSRFHARPYAAAAVNVFAADSDAEGEYLMSSMLRQFVALRRGDPGPLKPPLEDLEEAASPLEVEAARQALRESAVGSPASVRAWLAGFLERSRVDEVVINSHIFDHAARLKSIAIAAEALKG